MASSSESELEGGLSKGERGSYTAKSTKLAVANSQAIFGTPLVIESSTARRRYQQMTEIELTELQRLEIENRCLRAITSTEDIHEQFTPAPHLRVSLVGNRGLQWTTVTVSILAGLFGLLLWGWVLSVLAIDDLLLGLGLPAMVVDNLPEALAIFGAAATAWTGTYSWGIEGRVEYATRAQNASRRAAVLYSVLQELSDTLPGAVPDMHEYAYDTDDGEPNPLIERALGRYRGPSNRPRPTRNEYV